MTIKCALGLATRLLTVFGMGSIFSSMGSTRTSWDTGIEFVWLILFCAQIQSMVGLPDDSTYMLGWPPSQ